MICLYREIPSLLSCCPPVCNGCAVLCRCAEGSRPSWSPRGRTESTSSPRCSSTELTQTSRMWVTVNCCCVLYSHFEKKSCGGVYSVNWSLQLWRTDPLPAERYCAFLFCKEFTMLAELCNTVLWRCCAVLCCAMLCNAVLYSAVQYFNSFIISLLSLANGRYGLVLRGVSKQCGHSGDSPTARCTARCKALLDWLYYRLPG